MRNRLQAAVAFKPKENLYNYQVQYRIKKISIGIISTIQPLNLSTFPPYSQQLWCFECGRHPGRPVQP
jgi:hypothetical protein